MPWTQIRQLGGPCGAGGAPGAGSRERALLRVSRPHPAQMGLVLMSEPEQPCPHLCAGVRAWLPHTLVHTYCVPSPGPQGRGLKHWQKWSGVRRLSAPEHAAPRAGTPFLLRFPLLLQHPHEEGSLILLVRSLRFGGAQGFAMTHTAGEWGPQFQQ